MNEQLKDKTIQERFIFAVECAKSIRSEWEIGIKPINDIFSLAESKEFLLLRFPNDNNVSGAYLVKKTRNKVYRCIYINSMEPVGRQNFSLAHELYHVYFEESEDNLSIVENRKTNSVEKTAECFASNLLIPREALANELRNRKVGKNTWLNETTLFDIQKVFNVSFQALVVAMDDLKKYDEYIKYLPKNLPYLKKYYRFENWEKLSEMTEKYDCNNKLNSTLLVFEAPKGLKENLLKNITKGVVSKEDVADIMGFFAIS